MLLDVGPAQLLRMAGEQLPRSYRTSLRRYRYGPGVCKVDWALSGPVPWTAPACREAGTIHVGGTFEEIALSEAEVAIGRHPDRPFVLVAQPSVVDPSRAPAGGTRSGPTATYRTARRSTWPTGSRLRSSDSPPAGGIWSSAAAVATAADVARYDRNYEGGDINAGAGTLVQTIFRPVPRWNPYRTPVEGLYLCSSSTPPGGGVHGMCGQAAGTAALADRFGVRRTGRGGRISRTLPAGFLGRTSTISSRVGSL